MTDHLQAACAELETALVAGQDTTKARALIAKLEAERVAANDADAAKRQIEQAQVEAALIAAADRITAESRARVAAMLDNLKFPGEPF